MGKRTVKKSFRVNNLHQMYPLLSKLLDLMTERDPRFHEVGLVVRHDLLGLCAEVSIVVTCSDADLAELRNTGFEV